MIYVIDDSRTWSWSFASLAALKARIAGSDPRGAGGLAPRAGRRRAFVRFMVLH